MKFELLTRHSATNAASWEHTRTIGALLVRASLVVYVLAISVNVTFGFNFTLNNDILKDQYSYAVSEEGAATIEQTIDTEAAFDASQANQGYAANKHKAWLLG